jgi:hypothetical protein
MLVQCGTYRGTLMQLLLFIRKRAMNRIWFGMGNWG